MNVAVGGGGTSGITGTATATSLAAVGTLFLGDLSIPEFAYRRLGLDRRTPFATSTLVRIGGLDWAGSDRSSRRSRG